MRGRDTAGKGLSVRDKIAVVLCLLLALLLAVVPACGGDSKEDAPDQQVVKGQTPPSDAPDLSQQGDVSGQSEADQQPDGVDDRQPPVQQEEDADQTSAGAIAPPDFDGGDGTGDRSNSAEEAENPAQEGEPTQPAPPPSAGEVTGPTCTLLIECSAVLDHMDDLVRVWIASFRDSRCRAAGTRFRVTFCGLADYRPIPRNTKVRPAYRASNVLLKIVRNGKSPVPRSIRSTGLKLIWRCQSVWSCSQCLTFAAIPFPGFQTVEFSSSRLQSRRSIPRGFSLSVSSWLVAPFCP